MIDKSWKPNMSYSVCVYGMTNTESNERATKEGVLAHSDRGTGDFVLGRSGRAPLLGMHVK